MATWNSLTEEDAIVIADLNRHCYQVLTVTGERIIEQLRGVLSLGIGAPTIGSRVSIIRSSEPGMPAIIVSCRYWGSQR